METVTLLKDVLLDKGQIHNYYEGKVPLNLWRGLNVKKGMGLFELIEDTLLLSNGRPLPSGLAIVKDQYNPRFGAYHYTIAPAYDMPLSKFKLLLSKLAKLAVREAA